MPLLSRSGLGKNLRESFRAGNFPPFLGWGKGEVVPATPIPSWDGGLSQKPPHHLELESPRWWGAFFITQLLINFEWLSSIASPVSFCESSTTRGEATRSDASRVRPLTLAQRRVFRYILFLSSATSSSRGPPPKKNMPVLAPVCHSQERVRA